jgi:hypothetical protein
MLEDDNGYNNNSIDGPAPANMEGGKRTNKSGPPEDVMNVLKRLVEDQKNEVWLLSGLRVKGVLERVAERLPGMGIVSVFSLSSVSSPVTDDVFSFFNLQSGERVLYQNNQDTLVNVSPRRLD